MRDARVQFLKGPGKVLFCTFWNEFLKSVEKLLNLSQH